MSLKFRFFVSFSADVSNSHSIYCTFAAPAPRCTRQRPMCTTCLYASNADSCGGEGYQEDCSAMNDVSLLTNTN